MYLLIDENSPEMAKDCGATVIQGLYIDKAQALLRLEQRIENEKDFGYFCTERVDSDDEKCLTFYKDGDQGSLLWFRAKMIEVQAI